MSDKKMRGKIRLDGDAAEKPQFSDPKIPGVDQEAFEAFKQRLDITLASAPRGTQTLLSVGRASASGNGIVMAVIAKAEPEETVLLLGNAIAHCMAYCNQSGWTTEQFDKLLDGAVGEAMRQSLAASRRAAAKEKSEGEN